MWRIEAQDDEFGPEWRFFADVDHTEATVDDIIDLMLWATGGVVEFRKVGVPEVSSSPTPEPPSPEESGMSEQDGYEGFCAGWEAAWTQIVRKR